MKVIRMTPAKGDALQLTRNHAAMESGGDWTLCGYTLDGDTLVVEKSEEIEGPVTCEQCWAIIEFCRTVKQRKLVRDLSI